MNLSTQETDEVATFMLELATFERKQDKETAKRAMSMFGNLTARGIKAVTSLINPIRIDALKEAEYL